MRAYFLLSIATVFLSGCVSTYTQDTPPHQGKLERGRPVFVATPENGRYADILYASSGEQVAAAVKEAFAPFSSAVTVSKQCRDLPCLQASGAPANSYYVVPTILHWEDRNTAWSGKPDRITVKLVVYDGGSPTEIAAVTFSGKSKWATLGGDHPEDLLQEPTELNVKSFYGESVVGR